MTHVVAIDQGTTSSRALVFDREGRLVGSSQREFTQHFPRPGWVEHDADEIWTSQAGVLGDVLARCGLAARDVSAVGIANQRETTVVWDRATGTPIAPAIVWQDRRTADACEALARDGHADLFRRRTGLVLDAYFSGTKVAWLLDHVPGARERAEAGELAFGTVDAWLAWKLTGGARHVTDLSNASRTLMADIHAGAWDDELLDVLRVPRAVLPEIVANDEIVGEVTSVDALRGVPIAAPVGDQQAALMGQLCVEPGLAKNTYGTGCFLLMNTGTDARASTSGLLTTVAWKREARVDHALEGSVFVGGAIVQWLRDGLGVIERSEDVEALARTVDDNGGVVLVPALTGLGAPHWDAAARGTLLGMTRGTTRGHVARAALEGIAHEVADLVGAMQRDAGVPLTELRVDGGASRNDLLMQFQADLLGVPVVRPQLVETTAAGAAFLAGLAAGLWESLDELVSTRTVERRFEPAMSDDEVARRRERWSAAVDCARTWGH